MISRGIAHRRLRLPPGSRRDGGRAGHSL